MASKLIQLYSDEAATQKAYPICHEKGVFDSEGNESITAIKTTLGTKVDKVTGKGLSTNDYTTAEKNKLGNIEAGANKTTVDSALSGTSTNPVQNKVIKGVLDTHQSNILYGLSRVGKNILNYDAWKTVGVNGGTAVWENNGVTLTATSSDCYTYYAPSGSFPDDAKISVNEGDKIVLSWEFERASSSITGSVFIFPNGIVSGSTNTSVTTKSLEYTVPSGVSFLTFRFGINSGSGSVLKYKDVMICYKNVADVLGTAYELPALPNYDLTYLQAEDRAELVELVDNGAKNLYNPDDLKGVPTGLTVTRESDGTTLKINGTYTGSDYAYIFIGHFTGTKTGTYYLASTNTKTMVGSAYYVYTNDNHMTLSNTNDNDVTSYNYTSVPNNISVVIRVSPNTSFNNDTVKILICTKAAFGVSNKFVPYRPNYDLVGNAVSALNSSVFSPVTSVLVDGSIAFTDITGGYIRIGNLVVVNVRCTAAINISVDTAMLAGLPRPLLTQSLTAACVVNNLNYFISLLGTGNDARISNGSTGTIESGTTLILSCVYIAG